MAGVVKAMDAAMKSMNLEKISTLMDKFESQFEDLDVQSSYMENAMSQTTTTTVPQGDVETLLQQVADEAGYVLLRCLCCQFPDGSIMIQFNSILSMAFTVDSANVEY